MVLLHHNDPVTQLAERQSSHRVNNTKALAEMSLQQLCQLPHSAVQHQQRLHIMHAIRAALAKPALQLAPAEADRLVALARYLSDWPALLNLQNRGLWQVVSVDKALADIQMGQFDAAISRLEPVSQTCFADPALLRTKQQLSELIQTMPYPLASLQQGAISITPLQFYHVADFGWQYGDSEIAKLCNLPVFPSAQHWMTWLYQCQQERERHLFAVMHQDYGFIGSVCLQVFDGIGFFYYWLGKDFQGQGFGPVAVDILMQLGRHHLAMHSCYAKVFNYNLASNRAIAKLGFEPLPLKALPPSEAEVFYYLGGQKAISEHAKHLGWLLHVLNSGIELAAPDTCR